MALDFVEYGTTPCMESCAQVGSPDYYDRVRKEIRAWKNQLIRAFGEPPGSARFKVQSNSHDFGSYYDLRCVFSEDDEGAAEYAYNIDKYLPEEWDDEARKELELEAKDAD